MITVSSQDVANLSTCFRRTKQLPVAGLFLSYSLGARCFRLVLLGRLANVQYVQSGLGKFFYFFLSLS
jgi:hypothetical protein